MTRREQGLLLLAGVFILGGLVYRFWPQSANVNELSSDSRPQLQEANHLLRSRLNIITRQKTIASELNKLQKRFYTTGDLELFKISLLQTIEGLAAQSNLDVQQKNLVSIHDDIIGVVLEGKTNPESLFEFLYQASQARTGLRIQHLQIHSLPESKQLNYQVTIITLLVK